MRENPIRKYRFETYKVSLVIEDGPSPQISNSRDLAAFARALLDTMDANQEHFIILAMDTKNKVVGFKKLHSGGISSSIVDPNLVFRAALALDANSICAVHNHPSGNPLPSSEDRAITERLHKGGMILKIKLLDHIIIGTDDYYSFADAGFLGDL